MQENRVARTTVFVAAEQVVSLALGVPHSAPKHPAVGSQRPGVGRPVVLQRRHGAGDDPAMKMTYDRVAQPSASLSIRRASHQLVDTLPLCPPRLAISPAKHVM